MLRAQSQINMLVGGGVLEEVDSWELHEKEREVGALASAH